MEICGESQDKCLVCYESNNQVTMVKCKECSLTVHLKCYGVTGKSFDEWKCRYCIYTEEQNIDGRKANYSIKCRICNQKTFAALKPCANNDGFAHLICALWTPFTFVRNQYHMSPIHNIHKCHQYKNILEKLHCIACGKSFATLKCRIKSCKSYYHPLCLIGKKDKLKQNKCMIRQDFIIDKMNAAMFYAYCPKHAYLHQAFDPLKVRRSDREATFTPDNNETNKVVKSKANNDDIEMSVFDENKINYNQNSTNNKQINNIKTVFSNNGSNNCLQCNPVSVELSPAFCNNNNCNHCMYKIPASHQNMPNVQMTNAQNNNNYNNNNIYADANMGEKSSQQFLSNTSPTIATTPSTVSAMSTSRSRAPMPFEQSQQIQCHTQQMHNNNHNNIINNNPNILGCFI